MRSLVLIGIFCSTFCSAQQNKTAALIAQLDNKQFVIDHNAKASFSYTSKAANKLIRKGTKVRKELFIALSDSNKVIMVQLILCNIYFKKATFAGPKMITENDHHVYKYFLGEESGEGLIISEMKKNGDYTLFIRGSDLEKTRQFWKKKMNLQ
jgi:hypothetical protein